MPPLITLDPYQQDAVAKLRLRDGNGILAMDRGTGKTPTCLVYLDEVDAQRVLVVAPLWVIEVWKHEIPKALGDKFDVLDAGGGVGTIKERAARVLSRIVPRPTRRNPVPLASPKPLIILTNYDAYWIEPLRGALLRWKPDTVILDEAHRIRSIGSKQSRFAIVLSKKDFVKRRLPLTGSLIEHGWEDTFNIIRFIDPTESLIPHTWTQFEEDHLIYGFGGYSVKAYRNVERLEAVLEYASYRITKDQALDLPPPYPVTIPVQLSAKTAAAYRAMQRDSLAQINGVDEFGMPLSGLALARIVLTNILRQQQLTSGFCNTDQGEIVLSDEKLKVCKDLAEDSLKDGHKVVVFCRFGMDITRLQAVFKEKRVGLIVGGMTKRARSKVMDDMKTGLIDVLLCNIRAASLGLDLTMFSVAIFYSVGFSLDDFDQAKDRLYRRGQTRRVVYYFLEATIGNHPTVDGKIYLLLGRKSDIALTILRNPKLARRLILDPDIDLTTLAVSDAMKMAGIA